MFVRSFYDSDGDGIGDLRGLEAKLDYINDGKPASPHSLGARCIWLMPVAASPSYHGYDVTNYYQVNPQYGSNEDFKRMVAAAHHRGIRVLVDMVLNHTSSQHPYFQSAARDSASPYRHWYRWSATPAQPRELDPWGHSSWRKSPVRDEWYYGFFCCGMPDLDYTYTPVREEAKKIAAFWLQEMHADGFRLDAIPYLLEEDGKVQHTAGTHAFLREYGDYVRRVKPGSFTVGEVTDSIGALLSYYPNQLDSYFAFELADSIISGVRRGDGTGLLAPVVRMQREIPSGRWSPFLRNHDQPRTMSELGGDVARAKAAALILLTLPGTPFIYYGEEIGMNAVKPDPRLRAPMQWRRDHADGFTTAEPWERLGDDSATVTVEAQDGDPASLLNLYRRLVHLRASSEALATGDLVPLTSSDARVAAYFRRSGRRAALVIVNLGDTQLHDVRLASSDGALAPGSWMPFRRLGGEGADPAILHVKKYGRIDGYIPLRELPPKKGYLLELVPARDGRTSMR